MASIRSLKSKIRTSLQEIQPARWSRFACELQSRRSQKHASAKLRWGNASGHLKFFMERDPEIPPLAWRGAVGNGEARFSIGTGVERFDQGFFEGVWSGSFADPARMGDAHIFGSGAIIDDGGKLTITVPKCGYEQVFVLRNRSRRITYLANSLLHVLAAAGVDTAGHFFAEITTHLHDAFNRLTARGATGTNPVLISTGEFVLAAAYYNNFNVSADGSVSFCQRPLIRQFRDFADYRSFLSATLAETFANGTDPRRKNSLPPISTITRGYDSPAVSVLAKEAGCLEVLSIDLTLMGIDDFGADIGRRLGMTVRTGEHFLGSRLETLSTALDPDHYQTAAEFIATPGLGDDVVLATFEPWLANRTLLTGAWGDAIWARDSTVPNGVRSRIIFAKSLTEFRLRVGFAHVPVPTIGGYMPRSIKKVSTSREMRPYSVGGHYDRPIPRRIVESAGIERGQFGYAKASVNPYVSNSRQLWKWSVDQTLLRYQSANPRRR